jgi:hypothetical protein
LNFNLELALRAINIKPAKNPPVAAVPCDVWRSTCCRPIRSASDRHGWFTKSH